MRDDTADWLQPMLDAALEAGIDVRSLMSAATMPAAEADTPLGDWMAQTFPPGEEDAVAMEAIDWVRFGGLLRDALGWEDTYPAFPASPEPR
jgi:hypothetical protein